VFISGRRHGNDNVEHLIKLVDAVQWQCLIAWSWLSCTHLLRWRSLIELISFTHLTWTYILM